MPPDSTAGEKFQKLVDIMARLRAPGGCPWDREQTFDTIKPYTLEETYEVLEAIDNRDWPELAGELGDLLLQVLFYAQMAREQGSFSIDEVLDRLCNKLVDRHPHVFGDVKADTSAAVVGFNLHFNTLAKAEIMGIECKIGVFTRAERVIALAVGLLASHVSYALPIALSIIAILSFVTAGQRLSYLLRQIKD